MKNNKDNIEVKKLRLKPDFVERSNPYKIYCHAYPKSFNDNNKYKL